MKYKPSQAYCKEFTTSRPATGAVYDATGTPTATANRNGTDDGAFSLTVTAIDTGRYKITGTIPSGYVDGDIVNVSVAATVDGVSAKGIVDTFLVVSARESDIIADTDNIQTRLPTSLVSGRMDSSVGSNLDKTDYVLSSAGVLAVWDVLTSALSTASTIGKKLADWVLGSDAKVVLSANAHTGATVPTVTAVTNDVGVTQGGADKVWATAARVLTAGTNIALAKGTGVTGLNDLDAGGIRSAIGMASANLDTQLAAIAGYIDAEIGTIIGELQSGTYGLSALNTDLDALLARLTALRAGYLDNLSAGAVALQADLLLVKAKTDTIGTQTLTITTPVALTGDVTIIRGDSYVVSDGTQIDWVRSGWINLTGVTLVQVSVKPYFSNTVTTLTASAPTAGAGSQTVRLELTATQSALLENGSYDIQVTLAGKIHTLLVGKWVVTEGVTP
jgi:hypothetical protein